MKRAFLRKVKSVSCSPRGANAPAEQPEPSPVGDKRRVRTSAAMIGLALSMGASSLLIPRQSDGAKAAESNATEASSSVSQFAVSPLEGATSAPSATVTKVEHVVRAGQTLRQIARHYQVSVEAIATANDLTPTATLKPGQILTVPITGGLQASGSVSTMSKAVPSARMPQLVATADLNQLPSVNSQAGDVRASSSERVERESVLSRLRQEQNKLRSSLAELRSEESELTVDPVKDQKGEEASGQESATKAAEQPSLVQSPSPVSSARAGQPSIEYQVQPGDTLVSIARVHQVSQDRLATANQLPDPDWIRVNQSLTIPLAQAGQSSGIASGQSNNPTVTANLPVNLAHNPNAGRDSAEIRQSTPSIPVQPLGNGSELTYRVNPGDTVARIARAHHLSPSALISANRLSDPNVIFVGQVLRVPGAALSGTERSNPQTVNTVSLPGASALEKSVEPTVATVPGMNQLPSVVVPTVPAQANAVAPSILVAQSEASLTSSQQVAVAPTPVAPSPSGLEAIPQPEPAIQEDTTANPEPRTGSYYVNHLLSEIRVLRERRLTQQAEQTEQAEQAEVQQPVTVAAASVGATTAPTSLRGDRAVNPQFAPAQRSTQPTATPVRDASATRDARPDLVATAPLGSENYEPLLQPLTGRMVSPDLPPLPDANIFLPDGVMNGYIWPARGVLTSGYGWRWGRMHRGIDIASDIGTPIHSAAAGVVEYSGWNSGGYGNMIEIRHADGSLTRYAHLNRNLVQAGQRVSQGQQIGEMGSTGYSTGPHLHFEVHLPNEGTVNPISYLPGQ